MSKGAYGYGLMNSKLNTLQTLLLTPTPTTTPTLQQVLTADNTASLNVNIQDVNNSTVLRPTGLEISDAIGGIPKLNTIDSNIIQIDRDESSTTGDVYLAQYREYGTALNTTTTASGTFATSYAYDQITLNKVLGPTTTDLTVTSNQITSNDTLGITANTLNLNGQTVFDVPPHCAIDPTTGIDLANKGYVDSLVGQYSGGYNLYFNYSVTDPTYPTFQSLGQTVISAAQQTVITNITNGTQEVARFITLPIGITTIPIGLWDALIYGAVSGTGGDVHYYFELYKKTALNVDTLLVTSGISPDVNASPSTNPTSYTMNATITSPITLDLTDRLFMILYVTKTGVNTINLTTYFQNDFYSFTQSTLNAGTTLLSSNNTWTGTNKFDLAVSVDSIQTNAVGTTANLFTTQTTGDFNLLTSKTTGNVNILTGGSRGGTTNILTASTSPNTLNIGSGNLTTQFNGLLYSGNLDQIGTLSIGTLSAGPINVGRVGVTTTVSGTLQALAATINTITASSATQGIALFNNITTGAIDIFTGRTNGTVNILTNTGRVATTNFQSQSTAANIINIGSATSTTNILGLTTPSIASAAVGTAISLYTANTTGQCDFLTSTSRAGTLNIQSAGTGANAINIGSATSTTTIKGILKNNEITTEAVSDNMVICNGLSKSGTLSIQAASTVANTIEIGSANSTTNIKGLRVTNIDSIASGTMSIGATNTTGINLNSRGISNLTLGTNQYINVGTPTTAPTGNQVGYTFKLTNFYLANQAMTSGVEYTPINMTNFPAGTWLIAGSIGIATTATSLIQYVTVGVAGTFATINTYSGGNYAVNQTLYPFANGIFFSNGTTTLTTNVKIGYTGASITHTAGQTFVNMYATRIA